MDLTKFFLYTSLAAITYLMLLAWQGDYPPLLDSGRTQEPSSIQIPENAATSATDIPTVVPSSAPGAGLDISGTSQTNGSSNATSNSPRLVSIETDTLELNIDLSGGDIVQLALPKYLKQIDVTDDPFMVLEESPGRNYVAQSGLIGTNGIDNAGRADYQTSAPYYRLEDGENTLTVDLVTPAPDPGVTVTKRYSFTRDSYLIDISFIIDNRSSQTWQANAFGQIKRDGFDDPGTAGGFGRTFLGFVTTSGDDPYIKIDFDDIEDGTETFDMDGGWIGFSQHYFLSAWIPVAESLNRFTTRRNNINQYFGEFTSSAFSVAPGTQASHNLQFYAGPKDQYALAEISPNLELTIDYGFLYFLAAPIYWLLDLINSSIGNFGISIILLTVVVKGLFYKLSETQYKSMAAMRRAAPKMQQLKDRYGDDKMGMQKAMMELYKKENKIFGKKIV